MSFDDERANWLARYILPHESSITKIIKSWRLTDGIEAEDIVQECYAKLAALPSVSHIHSAKAYFLQTARSIFLMHIRRARLVSIDAVTDLEKLSIPLDEPSPEIRASDREQLRLLAQAVSDLEEPHRIIFTLRMLQSMSYKQISLKIGMSENAVQKALARSLQSLSRQLGRGGNQSGYASLPLGVDVIEKADQLK